MPKQNSQAAEVAILSGSTPPTGEAPSFEPVASSGPDRPRSKRREIGQSQVIRHANRVIETAKEERNACNVVSDIEDKSSQHRFSHCPQRDGSKPGALLPEFPSAELRKQLGRPSYDPSWQIGLPARIEAMEAHEREHAEFCERLGLDDAQERHYSIFQKLKSQAAALSKMRATCVKALALKSCAYIEIILAGAGDKWIEDLAASIAHDAANIGIHGSRAVSPESLDAHLIELIARHGAAIVEQDEADRVSDQCDEAFKTEKIERPAELYWKATDGPAPAGRQSLPNGNVRLYYLSDDIDAMRAASAPEKYGTGPADSPEGPGMAWRPDVRRAARRAEIIAAWDAWEAEIAAAMDRTGAKAAFEAADAAWYRAVEIEEAIMAVVPMTHAGLVAKARWLTGNGWSEEHLGDLALKIVKDIASSSTVFFGVDRGAHAPDPRATEAYREWLHYEGKLLGIELYGREGQELIPQNTAASSYHFPVDKDWRSASQPSSRAERMCDMLGIEWRAYDAERTASRTATVRDIADGLVPLMGEVA